MSSSKDKLFSLGKLIFPILLILVGLFFLIFGLSNNQSDWFNFAGLFITLAGISTLLYTLDKINLMVHRILLVVFLVISVASAYFNYRSISDRIDYLAKKQRIETQVIQRLKDIRTVQMAYKDRYEKFTPDFDTLIHFLRTDSVMEVYKETVAPDSMKEALDTLDEFTAWEMGLLVRDTFYIKVEEYILENEKSKKGRAHKFYIDSLPFVPMRSDQLRFVMDAGTITNASGQVLPVFEVKDPDPFDPDHQLIVGSMDEANTDGNWRE